MQVLENVQNDPEENNQIVPVEIKIDTSFKKLPRSAICFTIWKIDEGHVENLTKQQYGTFYDDCSYIIYSSGQPGLISDSETILREVKPTVTLEKYIHFWLGEKCSAQKSANVAYKVMELDSYMGTIATQFRESQNNESARFLAYFQNGITILSGRLTNHKAPERLYKIRGKSIMKTFEMDTISWEHFSSNDIMLLKTPTHIFLWHGIFSTLSERRKAYKIAKTMKALNNIFEEIIIIDDGYEQAMNDLQKLEWNKYLSLSNRLILSVLPYDVPPVSNFKLYKCGYSSGKYRIEEIKSFMPTQESLDDSNSAFILDCFGLGSWIWVGKSVATQEKIEAMRNARGFVKKKKYPSSTPVARVIEGFEPPEFTRLFSEWKTSAAYNSNDAIIKLFGSVDSQTLAKRPKLAGESQLIDDGTGEKYVYRITTDTCTEMKNMDYYPFFSNNCFIVQYTIKDFRPNTFSNNCKPKGLEQVLYIWYGKTALPDTINRCKEFAKEKYNELQGNAMLVKMHEGYETPNFLQIFGGKFLVFFSSNETDTKYKIPSKFLLKVTGGTTFNSKGLQVNPTITMSSKDCFIIKSDHIWVWCGQGSTGDAREIAKSIGSILGEFTLIMESKESDDFWNSVSDIFTPDQINSNYSMESNNLQLYNDAAQSTNNNNNNNNNNANNTTALNNNNSNFSNNGYSSCNVSNTNINIFPAANNDYNFKKFVTKTDLYLINSNRGKLMIEEILGFKQMHLEPECEYLLDLGSMIIIWLGNLSKMGEDECWQVSDEFIKTYVIQRDDRVPVAIIKQNLEPNVFKGIFDSWNDNFWKEDGNFEKSISDTQLIDSDFNKHPKFPLNILQQELDQLPHDVNPLRREVHLTHDDFVSIFKMEFIEFISLPAWKQQELKKNFKIF